MRDAFDSPGSRTRSDGAASWSPLLSLGDASPIGVPRGGMLTALGPARPRNRRERRARMKRLRSLASGKDGKS